MNPYERIESTTREQLDGPVTARVDPSGVPPEWSLSTGRRTDPGTWVAGSWSGSWSSRTGMITAVSPLVGAGEALSVEAGTVYDVWVRWTDGAARPVKWLGLLLVR